MSKFRSVLLLVVSLVAAIAAFIWYWIPLFRMLYAQRSISLGLGSGMFRQIALKEGNSLLTIVTL